MFSISEGIDGSVNSYTFNLTYSNSKCGRILKTIPGSFCRSEVCSYTLETSCFDHSPQVTLIVFASNILGDGWPSNVSYIGNIYTIESYTMFECAYNVIQHRDIEHVISHIL